MGSGACVRLTVGRGYINLYIDGIVEDQFNVSGLCGNYNKDPSDDYRDRAGNPVPCTSNVCRQFSDEWKVPDEENLFDCSTITEVEVDYRLPELCKCIEDQGQKFHCESPTTLNTGNFNGYCCMSKTLKLFRFYQRCANNKEI